MYAANTTTMVIGIIIGGIIRLIINLVPTIIAFVKGNSNKIQVLLLNIIPWGLSIIILLIQVPFLSIVIGVINIVLWIVALVKAIKGY